MAGTCASFPRHGIKSTVSELARTIRTGVPFPLVRFSAKSNKAVTCCDELPQGPSCIFVGPIETASKETLEALYLQARDAYYSGQPLILDDMFDKVELKLRWYGSKSVIKYPRCSLRRQSTYADAEEDLSQVLALASIWMLFLALGCSACLAPVMYTVGLFYQDPLSLGLSYDSQGSGFEFLTVLNAILFMAFGSLIGYPITSASVGVLQGLWRNDLVALKGACPNCGEEIAPMALLIDQIVMFVNACWNSESSLRVKMMSRIHHKGIEFSPMIIALGSIPFSLTYGGGSLIPENFSHMHDSNVTQLWLSAYGTACLICFWFAFVFKLHGLSFSS